MYISSVNKYVFSCQFVLQLKCFFLTIQINIIVAMTYLIV